MSTLLREREGAVVVLTLNRPDKLNALNAELLGELEASLVDISRDTSIACAIMTGAGDKAFAAGADIAAMLDMSTEAARAFSERGHRVCSLIERAPFPFIGAINIQCRIVDGRPVIFEINPRFSGGIPLTIEAGADFPRMLVDLVAGRDVEPSIGEFRDPVTGPHTIEPPKSGTVCRVVTFPPDDTFRGKIGAAEVAAFFNAMGSPGASTYSPKAPHPYMQKTPTLDFCLVLEGEITLVLDTIEVHLKAGDTVVQRGTNHAWSNRSRRPCVVAISSHDAAE